MIYEVVVVALRLFQNNTLNKFRPSIGLSPTLVPSLASSPNTHPLSIYYVCRIHPDSHIFTPSQRLLHNIQHFLFRSPAKLQLDNA